VTGRRAVGASVMLLIACAPLSAQGYRLRLDTRMQGVSWRGLEADSVPLALGEVQPDGGIVTPDGFAASCDQRWCHFFRAGEVLRGVPLVSQADLTMWGFGVPGLRLRANARYGTDLGDNARWPGTEPAAQLVEGYLEYARDHLVIQAGRHFLPSRLGAYGLDGARVSWRQGADGFELVGYGGWGLARGAVLPVTSPAVNPLDDFQPRNRQITAGGELGWTGQHFEARAEYRREVDPAVDYFVSERVAASMSLRPMRRLSLSAGGTWDLAMDQMGTADAMLTWVAPYATMTVGARRYMPFFDLWTIWGAFSPVAFNAYHGMVTTSPLPGLVLRARGERYIFDDAEASTPLVQVEDRGWRAEGGATWQVNGALSIGVGHQAEFGPGASSNGFDAQVNWRPVTSLTIGAHAASLRRPLELRFSDVTMAVYGMDAEWQGGERWRVGVSATRVDETRDRPDAAAMDWDQFRLAARVSLLWGSDLQRPALPPAIRTGGRP